MEPDQAIAQSIPQRDDGRRESVQDLERHMPGLEDRLAHTVGPHVHSGLKKRSNTCIMDIKYVETDHYHVIAIKWTDYTIWSNTINLASGTHQREYGWITVLGKEKDKPEILGGGTPPVCAVHPQEPFFWNPQAQPYSNHVGLKQLDGERVQVRWANSIGATLPELTYTMDLNTLR